MRGNCIKLSFFMETWASRALFYWNDGVGDYVAVIRYNRGDPVWLNAPQSAKLFSSFDFVPVRAHPSTKFPPPPPNDLRARL